MIELSAIRDLVAIFGVIAGFTYYVLTVRANQRNQKLQLEARRLDLFMSQYGSESEKHVIDVQEIQKWEWTDYNDWDKKYVKVPENWARYAVTMQRYNGLGLLAMRGHLDLDLVYQYTPMPIISLWNKFGDVVLESRNIPGFYEHYEGLEFLYNEMMKRVKEPPTL